MTALLVTFGPERRTRFPRLTYQRQGDVWRFIDNDPDCGPAVVGPQYRTQAELLGDLTRYAQESGYES
jgi:hypothetical protein